jgi:putative transposase
MLQRSFERKVKGSKNRSKMKKRVAKFHEHLANQRKDFELLSVSKKIEELTGATKK